MPRRLVVENVMGPLLLSLIATMAIAHETRNLFDGSTLDAWRGYGTPDVPAGWVIEDGALFRKAGGGDIMTREQFENFELSFEWKIGKGGNSGVMYLVSEGDPAAYYSGPEYQLLDNKEHADAASARRAPVHSTGCMQPMWGRPSRWANGIHPGLWSRTSTSSIG